MGRISRRVLVVLALIVIVGAGLRVGAAADPTGYQSVDERSYAKLARSLAESASYSPPALVDPVHWPPGAPALFAVAHRVAPEPRDGRWDVPAAYAAQALVATLLIPAAFVLGLLLGGPVAGLAAAAVVALYPPLARSPADLLSEPLGALLVVSGLAAVSFALGTPAWWRFAGAGLLLGATVLTRADLLLVPLIAAAVVGVAGARRASLRTGTTAAAATLAGALVLVVPWSVYASRVAQDAVVVSTGSASNLFVGTFLPGDGSMFGAKAALSDEVRRLYPQYRTVRPANVPASAVMGAVAARRPGRDREAALQAEGLANLRRYALGEPVAFAGMMAGKVGRLWLRYTEGTHGGTRTWVLLMHLTTVAAALAGLILGLWRARRAELVLAALVLLYVTALNAVLVSEPRHNLTVMPVLIAAGAAGWVLALRCAPPHEAPA